MRQPTKSLIHVASILTIAAASFLAPAAMPSATAAPLTIATQGKSTFVIVVPKVAPHSVNDAAAEMQRSVAEATGAKLPIVKDDSAPAANFVSLGITQQAKAAGISHEGIPDEGFRIVTKGGNLFIIGLDTTTVDLNRRTGSTDKSINPEPHPEIPGPAYTKNGELSHGTANGVYTFLENQLGVRWLMPGDLGRDVPRQSTLTVAEMDRTESPQFIYRRVILLGGSPAVAKWQDTAKLGSSIRISFGEGQHEVVPPEMYAEHPEWFAMDSTGKRPDPKGNKYYKLETTNPELIRFYADKVIARMKADPLLQSVSLTPSDGLGFSQSPESKALYDPPAPNSTLPVASVTPLVLKWYRDISEIVAKEYPQGKTAGFLYSNYIYPPQKGEKTLPKNFIPAFVAGQGGGFGYYRPEARKMEAFLLDEWGKIIPDMWFGYSFLTWLRNDTGIITPAAPDNYNFMFQAMAKNRLRGLFMYGTPTWSQGALSNYIMAKMLWNPTGDAKAIQHDWLMRAYGEQAGAVMEELYNKMDESWFADHFRTPDTTSSNISEVFYRRIYGAHYKEMEALFLKAMAQPMTPVQKHRLNLIAENFRVLQWRLRNAGYLPPEYSSLLTINHQQVFELLTAEATDFGMFPYALNKVGLPVSKQTAQIGKPAQEAKGANPNPNHVLFLSTKDAKVRLKPGNVAPGSSFLSYYIQNDRGRLLERGLLVNGEEIAFDAKANTPYYFSTSSYGVTLNPDIKWQILVPGAVPANASFGNKVAYLQSESAQQNASLYVYVPSSASLTSASDAEGVTFQTLTSEQKNIRALGKDKDATKKALKDALERFNGTTIQDLNYGWKFSPDPDKSGVAQGLFKPEFKDGSWKSVTAIGPWQRNGFPDFQGTGWYRRPVNLKFSDTEPTYLGNNRIYVFFGAIDGDANIYWNGIKIGEHRMADHANGWEVPVAIDVTEHVKVGTNMLAVEVTKDRYVGGLYRGATLMMGVAPK